MIDLRQVLQERETELSDLISSQPQTARTSLESLVPGIESRRASTLQGLSGLQGFDSGAFAAESGRVNKNLGRRLSSLSQGRILDTGRRGVEMRLNEASRRLDARRGEQTGAEQFSRTAGMDVYRRKQEEADLQRQLELGRRKEEISDDYARRGVALDDQYSGGNDYQAALYRALFGLTGAVGTGLYLNRKPKVETGNYINPIGGGLNESTVDKYRRLTYGR